MKKMIFALLVLVLMAVFPGMAEGEYSLISCGNVDGKINGEKDYVIYPSLFGEDEKAAAVNALIMEKARISDYMNLLAFGTGATGLRMDYEGMTAGNVLSVCISAEGKMLTGRPSQVYYPVTVDIETGEEIPLEALFSDFDGAAAYMEGQMENVIEESLSTHLENRSLFPVPYERYTLHSDGSITLWYEKDQLSFLSGFAGSVHFRFSELVGYYDLSEGSYLNRVMKEHKTETPGALFGTEYLGVELESALSQLRSTVDSEYYPGGACYETENARMRGTLLLTDENEEKVNGLLFARADAGDVITCETTLEEAVSLLGEGIVFLVDEDTAEQYRVCAGESRIYKSEISVNGEKMPVEMTLYADEEGLIRFLKLMIEE